LGTGTLAEALGAKWAQAGHELIIGGRSTEKAAALAGRIGAKASAASSPRAAAEAGDAVLLAVSWSGVDDMLDAAGPLDGKPLLDPTNAVEHGSSVLLTTAGSSGAAYIAKRAPGARVVKAFHLFPAEQWTDPHSAPATVAMCGDDAAALEIAAQLVRDAGGTPAVFGTLDRSRQLEEVAGFVIGLAFAGVNPKSAVPQA
jgi:predicted dinucleotide-binding enzyme